MSLRKCSTPAALYLLLSFSLLAGEPALRVGLYENPPFVIRDGEHFSGMAVELWERVAADLERHCAYTLYPSLRELVEAAGKGETDILVSNLAVTAERAEIVKYSYPWFDSGLRIIEAQPAQRSAWDQLVHNGHIFTYLLLCLLFLLVAFLVTLFRQRYAPTFPEHWRDGFFQSLAEVISSAKSGELPSRRPTWFRNLCVSVWMVFGLGIVAFVTSTVASAMTTVSLRQHGQIRTVHDLPGRKVGVLTGSGAESFLGNLHVSVRTYNRRENAREDLLSNTLDAFVADTAVLEYWLNQDPDTRLMLVGDLFHPYKFAFAARPQLAELVDDVSVELIRLHENGFIGSLRAKYFARIPAEKNAAPSSAPGPAATNPFSAEPAGQP